MNIPAIGSKWQHHNGVVYEVHDITNEHASPENAETYPIRVSYTGPNGYRWNKTLKDFLAKMSPVPSVGTKLKPFPFLEGINVPAPGSSIELVLPIIHVFFYKDPVISETGLYYYMDCTDDFSRVPADITPRDCVVEFLRESYRNSPITNSLFFETIYWPNSPFEFKRTSRHDLESIMLKGVNFIGMGREPNAAQVFGNRTTNGAQIKNLMAFATVMKHMINTHHRSMDIGNLQFERLTAAAKEAVGFCSSMNLISEGVSVQAKVGCVTLKVPYLFFGRPLAPKESETIKAFIVKDRVVFEDCWEIHLIYKIFGAEQFEPTVNGEINDPT